MRLDGLQTRSSGIGDRAGQGRFGQFVVGLAMVRHPLGLRALFLSPPQGKMGFPRAKEICLFPSL